MKIKGDEKRAVDLIENGQGEILAVKNALQPVVKANRAKYEHGNNLTRRWWQRKFGTGLRKTAFSTKSKIDGIRRMKVTAVMDLADNAQAISKLIRLISTYFSQISMLFANMRQRSLFDDQENEAVENEILKIQKELDRTMESFGYKRSG